MRVAFPFWQKMCRKREEIEQIQAFIDSVGDAANDRSAMFNVEVYNKVSAASEMIYRANRSIDNIHNGSSFKILTT